VLSEEALILAAVVGACALLVLGILELMWPTRRPRRRRAAPERPGSRPTQAVATPRPAQSILPRRLIDSPSARPSGFVFPPPADYVPPPLAREEARPVRPVGRVVPERASDPEPAPGPPIVTRAEPIDEPIAPPEPAYIPPPAVDIEPEPPEPDPVEMPSVRAEADPFVVELQAQWLDPEPRRLEAEPLAPEPEPVHPEPEPPRSEPEPPRVGHRPPLFEVETARFEPEPPRLEPEPPPDEPEPLRFDPRPPLFVEVDQARFEPEPLRLEPESPSLEPEPVDALPPDTASDPEPVEPLVAHATPPPAEPSPPINEPEPPPAARIPSFEPVAPLLEPVQTPPPAPPLDLPGRRRRSKVSPHARPHRVLHPAPHERRGPEPPAGLTPPGPSEIPTRASLSAPGTGPRSEATSGRDTPLVERCFALYQAKRFGEVLSVGEQALEQMNREPAGGASRETAALWSVVGLAKQALGDHDGAHAALASSIDSAAEPERATYRRHLASLTLEAAHARLARARSQDAGDRMAVIRTAIAWAERGLAVVPFDAALTETRETLHEALWQAYEQASAALLQRQEFPGARQILHEALADPKLPAARAAAFRGLISGTFGGEIGQLTAQAILGMQEGRESEAVGALRRAEELLQTIPSDALPPTRRDEVDQRLWWAYAEMGSRRLDAGDYEEALDPLIHALGFTSIGPDRMAETRAAVVRALEGIAAVRALSIRRLAEAGGRDEAIVAAGELHGLVKHGLELGLTEDDLLAAFARVRRLCEELGMDTRA